MQSQRAGVGESFGVDLPIFAQMNRKFAKFAGYIDENGKAVKGHEVMLLRSGAVIGKGGKVESFGKMTGPQMKKMALAMGTIAAVNEGRINRGEGALPKEKEEMMMKQML